LLIYLKLPLTRKILKEKINWQRQGLALSRAWSDLLSDFPQALFTRSIQKRAYLRELKLRYWEQKAEHVAFGFVRTPLPH